MHPSKATPLCLAALLVFTLVPTAFGAANDATSEVPTFHGDVLQILQANCQTCHRPAGLNLGGMIAPMSFTTYGETRPWAKSIKLEYFLIFFRFF